MSLSGVPRGEFPEKGMMICGTLRVSKQRLPLKTGFDITDVPKIKAIWQRAGQKGRKVETYFGLSVLERSLDLLQFMFLKCGRGMVITCERYEIETPSSMTRLRLDRRHLSIPLLFLDVSMQAA